MPDSPLVIKFNTPFQQAVEAANQRGVMLPADYYALPAVMRSREFTVSHIAKIDQIQAIFASLQKAQVSGISLGQWQKEIDYKQFGITKAHAETVFRNAMQTHYAIGHWESFQRTKKALPYLRYSAINDSRTSVCCRALSGIIRKVDDPFWASHTPPNHHNCRSTLQALTESQAQKRSLNSTGLNQPETAEMNPQKGWDYNPVASHDAILKDLVNAKTAKLPPILKSKLDEQMLKAWDKTNIAKKIPVTDLATLKDALTEYARIFPEHLPHGVKSVLPTKEADDFFMSTNGKGEFKIASIEITGGFNSHRDLFGAFENIKNSQPLTQHNEYALEVLWHEINHNRQIGIEKIKSFDENDPRRKLMEAVNQLVSRLSYGGFVERLGGKAQHQEWILENGYGYRDYVTKLRLIFDALGIAESVKGDLFNINFNLELTDINQHLTEAISKKVDVEKSSVSGILFLAVAGLDDIFAKRLEAMRPK